NAGKSPEAIDEIFAIVAKYDWARTQNKFNATDPAKNACLGAFTQNQMPLETAVKIIIAKKDSKNTRVRAFVRQTLGRLVYSTQEVNKQLREAFPEEKLPEFGESFGEGGRGGGGGAF
ncbi:MAG: hypothetical protein GXP24_03435, partial [Planctomycetes bacterium]|nr:hypothetical protein [Planctomycetota bacterium]